jgi:hypothetical protein
MRLSWPKGVCPGRRGPCPGRRQDAADGRLVTVSLQMAYSRARRCRWPGGHHSSADGLQSGKTLQMAGWSPYLCRRPTVGQDAADGRLVTLSLQTAYSRAGRCRWPAGHPSSADSPANATLSRRSRWGSAPNPAVGAPTPTALMHGKMGSIGPLPTSQVTASVRDYRARLNPSRCLPAGVSAASSWRGDTRLQIAYDLT